MNRLNWFKSRVGKRIYRSKGSCTCELCKEVHKHGIIVEDETHAQYLCDVEGDMLGEGINMKYFDTVKEVKEYENM